MRRAAVGAAAALAITASGGVVLLGAVLGVAAGGLLPALAAAGALVAVAVRWGSTSLDAIAGAQAVLGPGGLVGPEAAAAACWCAAGALVLASPARWPALAFGPAAALAVAGPAVGDAGDLVVRAVAMVVGVAVSLAAGEWVPRDVARGAALGLAVVAVAAAAVA